MKVSSRTTRRRLTRTHIVGSLAIIVHLECDDDTLIGIELSTLSSAGDMAELESTLEATEHLVGIINSHGSTVLALNVEDT